MKLEAGAKSLRVLNVKLKSYNFIPWVVNNLLMGVEQGSDFVKHDNDPGVFTVSLYEARLP